MAKTINDSESLMQPVLEKTMMEMLAENARNFPDKPAVIYSDQRITYSDLHQKTKTLSHFLIDMGIRPGSRVGLMMNKTPEFIISFLGVSGAGAIALPIDFNQPVSHLQLLMDLAAPEVMIVSEPYRDVLMSLRFSPGFLGSIVAGGPAPELGVAWDRVMAYEKEHSPSIFPEMSAPAYLNLTSGTTGRPKCAVATHANIFWNTRAAVEALHLTPDDIHLCLFAVYAHPHELVARPLYLGGTLVLLDKVSPKAIAGCVAENQVTCMMAIPSLYQTLVRLHDSSPFHLSTLRLPESGGMHTFPALLNDFETRFGKRIVPVWGSTEASGIALAMSSNIPTRPGSVGKPIPHYGVRIVDDDGKDVRPGEVGEMVLRGPGVVSRYFSDPVETDRCMRDGWFFTGDMFWTDADGYYFFAGRRQGMMKVAGMKVYPVEIEETLLAHPDILEAVVVKQLDELHGEVPKAIIVVRTGASVDKRDVRIYCEQRLAKSKVPRVIEFRSEIPKTSGGKICWQKLQESQAA